MLKHLDANCKQNVFVGTKKEVYPFFVFGAKIPFGTPKSVSFRYVVFIISIIHFYMFLYCML